MPHDLHTELIAVDLTDEELLAKCRELREVLQELIEEQAAQKRTKEMLKGRLAEITTRYTDLLQMVRTGRMERKMKIRTIYDVDEKQVYHTREDTGEELPGRRRAMTDAEYSQETARQSQAELPLDGPGPIADEELLSTEPSSADVPLLVSCEACGHLQEAHAQGEGPCRIAPCTCPAYVPFHAVPGAPETEPAATTAS